MSRDKKLIQFYLTTNCNSRCKTCSIWRCKGDINLNPNVVAGICAQNLDADFVLGGGDNFYVTIRSLIGTDIDWNNCDRCAIYRMNCICRLPSQSGPMDDQSSTE